MSPRRSLGDYRAQCRYNRRLRRSKGDDVHAYVRGVTRSTCRRGLRKDWCNEP
ncbi:uncharacterized protein ANIA_11319 [Aspergillus nidulans FGSC A4]|uniref:Uncharacterized protein n=1 Tax=Emericella nidulans (strain FGSC A4 / ATCC 38163 / CBS 112.46 / NRRL 194 / M139) TaxID=227321 RepID=C8VKJ3_EMENI|nr:hypothetical protein [Aspergillus nidulans FGSC A4]CBF85770.1 TPA: hypothetical protein ANIA_11319 [Aspergillus nidulans FGSC A4]